ncbi:probable serine/threonine-protein kinase PBL28 isoform X2 [Rutidosis leptorrhynchoides]|uniref:probable serine/threonine-protein kinase PBL28 isoform X2 n=1 Tax=Rutidosis leptorrhynchoides TaxID=125765 RepID=UPI003A9A2074
MLFYEYVSLKFLHQCLDDVNLTWDKRLKICIDVAHGLDYLHNEMEDQKMIIHGDLLSETIELDETWGAKIVGFEESRMFLSNQDDHFIGELFNTDDPLKRKISHNYYLDPEYKSTGILKKESDIFSFGVVMLEILCGALLSDVIDSDDSEELEDYRIWGLARIWDGDRTIQQKLSPILTKNKYGHNLLLRKRPTRKQRKGLNTFTNLMYKCLNKSRSERPHMKVIIEELQKASSFFSGL